MKLKLAAVCMSVALGTIFCTPDDSERCGDGFTWDDENETCVLEEETGADDTGSGDAEADAGDGMGSACTEEGGQCEGLEADYCTANQYSPEGYCTTTGCTMAAEDCPEGYVCCEMTVGDVDFCATPEDFETMGGLCTAPE